MSLLAPIFLFAGLMIGLPIVLHLLRRKPQEFVNFPSLRLLKAIVLRESKRHRILRWVLLVCRCLLLLLLAFAFARPFLWNPMEPSEKAKIIALDNSFSMQAGSRWGDLLQWAEGQISDLGAADHCGILLMNPSPTWLTPLGSDPQTARAALRHALPGFTDTRYAPALRVAVETLAAWPAKNREIIWTCDHQRTGWQGVDFSRPLRSGIKIRFPEIAPAPARQAAITSSRIISSSEGMSVEVTIRQFTPTSDTRTLSVWLEGKMVAERTVTLNASSPTTVTIPVKANIDPTTSVKVSLDPDEVVPDDISYAVMEADSGVSVFLSPTDPPAGEIDFVAQALASAAGGELETLSVHNEWPRGNWPAGSIAVLRGPEAFRPPQQQHLENFLAGGGAVWLMLDGSAEQISWLQSKGIAVESVKKIEGLRLQNWDTEHPLLEPFAKGNLMPLLSLDFQNGWSLRSPTILPVATWNDHSVAIAETEISGGRLFITGFDLSRRTSSFPISPAFVPFVHRAALWLVGGKALPRKVGHEIALPDEMGTWSSVDSPRETPAHQVNRSITPEAPGIYRFQSTEGARFFAVNLSEEESDLSIWPASKDWLSLSSNVPAPEIPRADLLSTIVPGIKPPIELAWWLIFAVLLLLIGEIALANRTAL